MTQALRKVITLIILSLFTLNGLIGANIEQEEKNYIHQHYSINQLKEILVTNQQWVKYPAYSDRKAWDALIGEHKEEFISKGKKYLNYEWKVIKATDYLAFDRTGNRTQMEKPFGDNNRALMHLVVAE